MKRTFKVLTGLVLVALLALTIVTPARAFEARTGEDVVIAAGEVVEDDLYVSAATFTLDGTVKGDLVVAAQTITINGTIEGDLMAAGQAVIINGTVMDDARIAGATLFVGEGASIGDDLLAGGYSLETRSGSQVGGSLGFGGGQALLAGNVAHNVFAATGGLELRGEFGGNVKVGVGEAQAAGGPPPSIFMPPTGVTMPTVNSGLTIDPAASIGGNLEYTQSKDLSIPGGVVAGKVTRLEPTMSAEEIAATQTRTPMQKVLDWCLNLVRTILTLFLLGLLLVWLFPKFVKKAGEKIQTKPWHSLGWGVVSYAALFFAILVVFIAMILLAMLFGFLTLGKLTGLSVFLGLLTIILLIFGFILAAGFVVKIVASDLIGKLILNTARPGLGEHKIWPLLVGVVIIAILISLPYVGWLFKALTVLFGLGALWLLGREALAKPVISNQSSVNSNQ
jgi:cytoskeletal protein CcmA (bactofilin family)